MRQIDVRHEGIEQVICCYALDDVIVDPGPTSTIDTLLEALGDEPPAHVLLTHVHLDHAGAAGTLARRWPDAEIWVHERGARHVIDPSKLVASAARIYGDDMDRLWGAVEPVPEERLRILSGGERIGPWRVEYTPGHAWHHVSYLHEPTGTALVGDVCGVRIGGGPILPPTPPPDIDLEAWHESLRTVTAWDPERIGITHFGAREDVARARRDDARGARRVGRDRPRHERRRLRGADRGRVPRRAGTRTPSRLSPRDAAVDAVGRAEPVLVRPAAS